MDVKVALEIVRNLIAPEYLSSLQEEVFKAAWMGKSYAQIAELKGYAEDHIKSIGADIWQLLSQATDTKVTKRNFRAIIERLDLPTNFPIATDPIERQAAIDVSIFYGREDERQQLQQWIVRDRCRLVVLLGMGGIGKSSLAVKIAQELQSHFCCILWRSLINAPPINELLPELIRHLKSQIATKTSEIPHRLPDTIAGQVEALLRICQQERCLIILDNCESILEQGNSAGRYRPECADYGYLFSTWGQVQHNSCLLLTSREKPTEIGELEGVALPVRSKSISGLDPISGQKIFADKGCDPIPPPEWAEIDRYYGGNPLALKLVAAALQDLTGGDVGEILPYLRSERLGFVGIHVLLQQQWERLSIAEQQVMYWLAIQREPISTPDLEASLHLTWYHGTANNQSAPEMLPISPLLATFQSLRRRSIIQHRNGLWSLQPVVMEYVTSKLVSEIGTEIERQQPYLLNTHALLQANNKAYIRKIQVRLILQAVIERLLSAIPQSGRFANGEQQSIAVHLRDILAGWQQEHPRYPGYLAGNILNLLCHLDADLRGLNCSDLAICQAYLVERQLVDVNFARAQILNCAFTETFSTVLAVAYSLDGKKLASSDSNGQIRVWRVRDGECLLSFIGHNNWVRSLCFSPDGLYLASTSDDRTIKIWDLEDGTCLRTIDRGIYHLGLCFSTDGKTIISGGAKGSIHVWDVLSGDEIGGWKAHEHWIMRISIDALGDRLVTGSADGTVKVWEYPSGKCLHVLTGHEGWIMPVKFSPDGKTIVSGGMDATVRLWDAETGECLHILKAHRSYVWSVAFSPDGNAIASGGVDGILRLWRTNNGECIYALEGHTKQIWSVAFHPDGKMVASGGEDRSIRFWQTSDGKCLQTIGGYNNGFRAIAWSPDGQHLVTGSEDTLVRSWDLNSATSQQKFSGHSNIVSSIAYHPQGHSFASGAEDRTIRIWNSQTATVKKVLRGHPDWVSTLTYSPTGQYLASAGSDRTIRIWEPERGRCMAVLNGHEDRIWTINYHPHLNLMVSASEDQTVRLWDLDRQETIHTFRGHHNRVVAAVFDPRGTMVASGGMDSNILLWDIETATLQHTLSGHEGWIMSLAYSYDGKWLLSGSTDYTIKVWSMETGKCTATAIGHESWVRSIAVSPDNRLFASASEDGTIRLWDLPTASLISTRRAIRPYEGMDITATEGLTKPQIETLKALGAVSREQ
jgi:WD40 repeat protein